MKINFNDKSDSVCVLVHMQDYNLFAKSDKPYF